MEKVRHILSSSFMESITHGNHF